VVIRGQEELKEEAVCYFKQLYNAQNSQNLPEKCYTASLFPSVFLKRKPPSLEAPVTMPEIKAILIKI
jgi:hypothetical protein